jgi:long-chain acyl-CoA synthetase
MAGMKFVVEVEKSKDSKDGKPSMGPAYRNIFAIDGFPPLPHGLESCWDAFRLSVEKCPENRMLGHREIVNGKAGKYVWKTYKQVYELVIKLGNAIRSCGVQQGSKCGIYGINCPQWIMSMEACNAHGICCVPLYDTLGANAVEYILNHAEVEIAFVEQKKIPEVLKTFPSTTKYLKTLVSFGNVTQEQRDEIEKYGLEIYSWDNFLQLGENAEFDLPVLKKSDISTIMYTSGTTGDPKGVMISNESILVTINGANGQFRDETIADTDIYLSYLPLAHIFDRVVEEWHILNGAAIGFWRGDVKFLVEDIVELRPTILSAVPRVLDRIYVGLTQKISSGGFVKKTLFNAAYAFKSSFMRSGYKHENAAPMCDRTIFTKIKEGLGGNIRLIISGGAPLAVHVEDYLRVVTCAHTVQGYGLTETCAASFVSLPNEISMIGTVGPPLPNVDICLESVPELGYDAIANPPRGEVCMRGKTLFSGYYKSEELTNEVMIDGWFHTGDIGEWQPDGSLKIIDRKKNIFKLSQGEYVAVENLEGIYSQVPIIESIWVYGNSLESSLVAVVNANKQALEQWAAQNGLSGDFNSLCEDPRSKVYILGELTKIAKEKKLKGFENIRGVHLDPVAFDVERDLLTPSYKKKRPQMLKYYKGEIDAMYISVNKPRN